MTSMTRDRQLEHLSGLCYHNALALRAALAFCHANAIGSFRITSQFLPLRTHPKAGYRVEQLPESARIIEQLKACGEFARRHAVRTTFHPDQFVVLNSPSSMVCDHAFAELAYQAEVAEWVHADVITIHAGGMYADKTGSLARLRRRIERLAAPIRSRLALENDDTLYAPSDLVPVCMQSGIPFVYDVHHHRCLPDGQSIDEVTVQALKTWDREPLMHIASPREGWSGGNPRMHHDYIDPDDFPGCWRGLTATVEVEAKAKECAVLRLAAQLRDRAASRAPGIQRRD
jgi:UV DNA damage endonuclease